MKSAIACVLCLLVSGAAYAAEGTVVSKGLSVTATPVKKAFGAKEPIKIGVMFKNTSKAAFQIFDPAYWVYTVNSGTWSCVLKNVKTGAQFKPTVVIRPMMERISAPVVLAPGKTYKTTVQLTKALSYVPLGGADAVPHPNAPRRMPARNLRLGLRGSPLPAGRYIAVLTVSLRKGAGLLSSRSKAPFWTGTVKLTTAAFDFGGKGAATAAIKAGTWQKLSADQRWYKSRKGKEREFTGVLKVTPKPPPGMIMGSTLQRACYYFVGQWRVYTGARRVPVLEALNGKKVVFRGKAVEMNLEGQHLKEIWPAAVKLVGDAEKGDVKKIKPAPPRLFGPPVRALPPVKLHRSD